ncbi:hypothetical protein PINS_up009906 [Pythium insidiosum]|nr:hypothetical protein PINS_up009906 [Pythium insidiosum]
MVSPTPIVQMLPPEPNIKKMMKPFAHDQERGARSQLGALLRLVDPLQNRSLALTAQQQPDNKFQDVLLVRLFFVLGNLCAGNDRNRELLGVELDALPALLQSLTFYGRRYASSHATSEDCDVLVKLVRLLANVAINADAGAALNAHVEPLQELLEVLDLARSRDDEELALNIVSCLTNLSYYCTAVSATTTATAKPCRPKQTTFIEAHRLDIAKQLAPILWDRNEEAVVEATRAFGNLSRFRDVLRFMAEHQVLDCLVILLDHSHREIVYTVCGVLMNAALDPSARRVLTASATDDGGSGRDCRGGGADCCCCSPASASSAASASASACACASGRARTRASRVDARVLLTGILESAGADGDAEMSGMAAKVLFNLLLLPRGLVATTSMSPSPSHSSSPECASRPSASDRGGSLQAASETSPRANRSVGRCREDAGDDVADTDDANDADAADDLDQVAGAGATDAETAAAVGDVKAFLRSRDGEALRGVVAALLTGAGKRTNSGSMETKGRTRHEADANSNSNSNVDVDAGGEAGDAGADSGEGQQAARARRLRQKTAGDRDGDRDYMYDCDWLRGTRSVLAQLERHIQL